ncbi:hypothetical protein EVAR_14033_1 [Eumeta japonica]|uniref:Uncharacterized protein n=1 Tax=Eumeta variegata TaxID=151549 RepID=A0A4C1X8Y8_EUMVA|nr:hypothetical protein EVAR_14033_1 [Eumeta japonica]
MAPQASETHAKPFRGVPFFAHIQLHKFAAVGKPCSLLQSGHIIFTFIADRFDGWKAACEFELLSPYFIVLIVCSSRGRRSGRPRISTAAFLSAWRRCTSRLSYSKS